ncbi:GNAT family N-acetyltransferase [Pseudomonas bohemica]|uniref:GNAT family N-acetyltransferase n=1 Tax=Pseudomonas bohemica TaxID=2044872 RepID=UPI0018FE4513|nr:GNAT family N-acetyltransferase [Pseudomonas bohemica]
MLMHVRIAALEDVPALIRLYRHLNPSDDDAGLEDAERSFNLLKAYPGSGIFVGCYDGNVVCTCTLIVIPNITRAGSPYALIENVVTHGEHRNKGYGKMVIDQAVKAAWNVNCYKVMLMTGSQRPAVHNFYRAAGFEQNKTGFQIRRAPERRS